MKGVVTPGEGVICNQGVVSWGFSKEKERSRRTQLGTFTKTQKKSFFTVPVSFHHCSLINIDDTLPVLVSASRVCPLRF